MIRKCSIRSASVVPTLLFVLAVGSNGHADSKHSSAAHSPAAKATSLGSQLRGAQRQSVKLIDPRFVSHLAVQKSGLPAPAKHPWNLVFLVLESAGRQRLFSDPSGKRVPMPFLEQLARRSLHLTKHFSPSNSSGRSLLSIFSGLYPMPERRIFATSGKATLPSLFTLLTNRYDRFLVSPTPLNWYFPRDFLVGSGLTEMHGHADLSRIRRAPGKVMSRDERDTVAFFIDRLQRAREPFAGVYTSFVAHWPYPDYGPEYQLVPPTKKINRYTNNLVLLDRQIERIFKALQRSGRLARTVVVVVADHGEAFALRHRGNWGHARASFNENYEAVAIVHQPELFKPRRVVERTLHIDLLPTLLDAIGVGYNEHLVQGESLFQRRLRRRYSFFFGNENTLSSISREGIKLQISFKRNECWVYDLHSDPDEQRKLGCRDHTAQKTSTLLYRDFQRQILRDYSRSWATDRQFHGQAHPGLRHADHRARANSTHSAP